MRQTVLNSYFVCCALTLCILYNISNVRSLTEDGTMPTKQNEFLFFATIVKTYHLIPICSGTLVTGLLVLTTATCLKKTPMDETRVLLGQGKMQDRVRYNVASWKTYSDWALKNNEIMDDDDPNIAIITLASIADLDSVARLALLPIVQKVSVVDELVSLVGWAKSRHLFLERTSTVKVIPTDLCVKHYSHKKSITKLAPKIMEGKLFCTNTDTQYSAYDEGGPLIYNHRVLVGINYFRHAENARLSKKNLHINYLYYDKFLRDELNLQEI